MRKIYSSVLAAALVLATSTFCFAEQIDNPSYKNWAKFKAGSTATLSTQSDMGGTKTEMETTTTLVDISPDKAVTETKSSMTMAGQKMDMPAQKTDVPAKIEKPAVAATAPAAAADVKESSEEVDVLGKKIKCKVTETKTTANGMTSASKVWTSEEVPGGIVKSETTMSGAMAGTMKMTLTKMDVK